MLTSNGSGYNCLDRPSIYTKDDLLRCSQGDLFAEGYARLPAPPLLMLDEVLSLDSVGGKYGRGHARGARELSADDWFFQSHFTNYPLMPGTLLLESMWQLTGVYVAHFGHRGYCRVSHSGNSRFSREVTPKDGGSSLVTFIEIKKLKTVGDLTVVVADGYTMVGELPVCECSDLRLCFSDAAEAETSPSR